jgi:hypothetical protein
MHAADTIEVLADTPPATRPAKLRLRSPATDSPSLAQLNWHPKTANAVWTRAEWTNLCKHLHNSNPSTHFIMGFRDADGCKKYVRSKRLPVDRAISWSWQSIAGSPKSKLTFVPYSTNDRQQSRWGGMDFDAHQGEAGRARELAFAAFRVLLNAPDLAVILENERQRRLARLGCLAGFPRCRRVGSLAQIRCPTDWRDDYTGRV